MFSKRLFWLEILLLLIITIPLFSSLLNGYYFSMHDDQHIARLFLLDQAIRQGDLYPRWVGTLGYSFGYPLFNFYPPLIYYVAEGFHLIGLSLIWSIKSTIILGFILSVFGMHLFLKKKVGAIFSVVGATLYGYFTYHAVLVFVRGAFAEFFAMALLPFAFLTLENMAKKKTIKSAAVFAVCFALLILTHPLIAFPFIIFLGFYGLFHLLNNKKKIQTFVSYAWATLLGLVLSAFFWLPAMLERKFTQVDLLSTTDLSTYSHHYVCPSQFLYSAWGYGGSVPGCFDGLSFQMGKVYLILLVFSLIGAIFYWIKRRKFDDALLYYTFYLFLAVFSLFMTTNYSSFLWDNLKFLAYLQFPWRFLTYAGFFIAVSSTYSFFFWQKILKNENKEAIIRASSLIVIILTIFFYQKYFKPQTYVYITDQQKTSFEEIAWNVSRTSLDFIPQGVPIKQLNSDRKTVDIDRSELQEDLYNVHLGTSKKVEVLKNTMREKEFIVDAFVPLDFWLYTFYFPGWKAYLNEKEIPIFTNENNIIRVNIPQGYHNLKFVFENTPVRSVSNFISLGGLLITLYLLIGDKFKEVKRRFSSGFNKALNKYDR